MNLPPLATHSACLLLGTLVLKPGNSSGLPDSAILVPWKATAIRPAFQQQKRYRLVLSGSDCALGKSAFKLWQAPGKQLFLLVPRTRDGMESLRAVQGRTDVLLKEEGSFKICQREGTVAYD